MRSVPEFFEHPMLRSILLSIALCAAFSIPALGQYAVLDAKQFSPAATINTTVCNNVTPISADMCGQIQAAICALPLDSGGHPYGVVDARQFSGSQTCASNPFASPTDSTQATLFSSGNITLLLGPVTVDMQATWFVPQQTKIIGRGPLTTHLKANGTTGSFHGLPANNCDDSNSTLCYPMICMGPTGNNISQVLSCETPATQASTQVIQVEGVEFDGNGVQGAVGVANTEGEEQSWVRNSHFVGFYGFADMTLGPTGKQGPSQAYSQNSGPYGDLVFVGPYIGSVGTCTPTSRTYGIYAGNNIQVSFIGHITFTGNCDSSGSGNPNSNVIAMNINGPGVTVQNVHCEKWYDCVLLGDKAVTNATVSNITGSDAVQNTVHINGNKSTNGLLTNIYQAVNGKNAILDSQASVTITAGANGITVPSYVMGLSSQQGYSVPTLSLLNGLTLNSGGTADTGISRDAPGVADLGTGGAASTAGTLRLSRLQTGSLTPTCTFATGGGVGPSCALDTNSTDSAGIIIATTGTGLGTGTGTITLTFSTATSLGANKPSCVFIASDAGGGAWSALAVMKDKTPTIGPPVSDTFTFTNGTGPTPLSVSTAYWINYHCWAK